MTENIRYTIEQAQAADATRYDSGSNWEESCSGDNAEQVLERLLSLLNGDEVVVVDSWLRLKIMHKDGTTEIRNY